MQWDEAFRAKEKQLWRKKQNNVFVMSITNPNEKPKQLNTDIWRSKKKVKIGDINLEVVNRFHLLPLDVMMCSKTTHFKIVLVENPRRGKWKNQASQLPQKKQFSVMN